MNNTLRSKKYERKTRIGYILTIAAIGMISLVGCNVSQAGNVVGANAVKEFQTGEPIENIENSSDVSNVDEAKADDTKTTTVSIDKIEDGPDLVFFMGESNMSGFGGDASLAPSVSEDAASEFRAVSDPEKLYPIKEPFGENEGRDPGLHDFPGAKKGSLVSAFVNEYHNITGRKIIAVSASMGSTDMDVWTSTDVMNDVMQRFDTTLEYLDKKDTKPAHIYVVWLHGESDGLKGAAESTYKEALVKVMTPLFKKGLQKVFIITPGRTIDTTEAYINVINAENDLCKEDKRFALATDSLHKISTEKMTDQYQYNQHALNFIGIEAAKAVAYFTENGTEKTFEDIGAYPPENDL